MMRRLGHALLLALVVPSVAGCMSAGRMGWGLDVPASAGAAALGEGLIGRTKGLKLSADARARALDAEYQALQYMPAGQTVAWQAGDLTGAVVPTQLYRIGSRDCRGYSQTIVKDGREARATGTACRAEDGFWTPVD